MREPELTRSQYEEYSMLIPIEQFITTYIAKDGTEHKAIHVKGHQCPVCLAELGTRRHNDGTENYPNFVTINFHQHFDAKGQKI